METVTFTFPTLPTTLAELQKLPEASLDTPFKTAALTVLALCNYAVDVSETLAMLDWLRGPRPLSVFEKQFIRDRLAGKDYVLRSYLGGTGPQNNYTPSQPYTVTVFDNPYSYQDANYATLHITSSGADSPRQVKLRKKADGQWLVWDIFLYADIRQPAKNDPWA